MPPHFPNINEYNGQPLWYLVQVLSWRDEAKQLILDRIEWLKNKADGDTPPSADLRIEELKQVLEMFEHRKLEIICVEAKET